MIFLHTFVHPPPWPLQLQKKVGSAFTTSRCTALGQIIPPRVVEVCMALRPTSGSQMSTPIRESLDRMGLGTTPVSQITPHMDMMLSPKIMRALVVDVMAPRNSDCSLVLSAIVHRMKENFQPTIQVNPQVLSCQMLNLYWLHPTSPHSSSVTTWLTSPSGIYLYFFGYYLIINNLSQPIRIKDSVRIHGQSVFRIQLSSSEQPQLTVQLTDFSHHNPATSSTNQQEIPLSLPTHPSIKIPPLYKIKVVSSKKEPNTLIQASTFISIFFLLATKPVIKKTHFSVSLLLIIIHLNYTKIFLFPSFSTSLISFISTHPLTLVHF
ncbi:hypothetical protein VP01_2512g2 [Puccinia sorghi]|uniref:Uncharacterized protein n=1 Tax=Puccinia sorghi TaxID=27349 RepID=A0A0L6V676_9BASI|nr:hypothetical protein VP01_2512g2 [Puccinia sorghi]